MQAGGFEEEATKDKELGDAIAPKDSLTPSPSPASFLTCNNLSPPDSSCCLNEGCAEGARRQHPAHHPARLRRGADGALLRSPSRCEPASRRVDLHGNQRVVSDATSPPLPPPPLTPPLPLSPPLSLPPPPPLPRGTGAPRTPSHSDARANPHSDSFSMSAAPRASPARGSG
jgi:hypothetical protein